MSFEDFVKGVGNAIELAGIAVVVVGIALALGRFAGDVLTRRSGAYRCVRTRVGRAILLGLEFLVAGDIVETVAIDPSFRSAGVLAVIVLIRTFLSFTLEIEITGKAPWVPFDERARGRVGIGTVEQ